MISYHELTANQPREGNGRQQQFIVIFTVMTAAFLHSFAMAGGFHSVTTSWAVFEGGEYCYKQTARDYATSNSLAESIGKDMGLQSPQKDDGYADVLYSLYLDSPLTVSAERLRFAVGHLAHTAERKKINHNILMKKNQLMAPLTDKDQNQLAVQEIWPRLPYATTHLPKAKHTLVAHFPFTNGFVSALLFTYKVMPSLLRQAKEEGMKEPLVVMSTCSVRQHMCTHYALSGKAYLLGQPDTQTYIQHGDKADTILPWYEMKQMILKPLQTIGLMGHKDEL